MVAKKDPGPLAGTVTSPDWLSIRLATDLASKRRHEYDDFGWSSWYARIYAGWDCYEDPDRADAVVMALRGLDLLGEIDDGDDEIEVPVGGCDLMHLAFDEPHPVFGEQALVESHWRSVFEAADALSQDLADLVAPLTVGADEDVFVPQVMQASELGWFDDMLLVRSVGIHSALRGHGIGGWAVARSVLELAPTPSTLVALKAAPLNRSDFLRSQGVEDPDTVRDLSSAQQAAWDRACERIAANWQRWLGLSQLDGHPGILFGPGGTNDAIAATMRHWARD